MFYDYTRFDLWEGNNESSSETIRITKPLSFDETEEKAYERHQIQSSDFWLVRLSVEELGEDNVKRISFKHYRGCSWHWRSDYFNCLRDGLGTLYIKDNTKTYLRKLVGDKFSADLGL